MAIESMVPRTDMNDPVWGRDKRISVAEALKICIWNGAYASFEENLNRSIRVGKLADFTILADCPHDVESHRIKPSRSFEQPPADAPCT